MVASLICRSFHSVKGGVGKSTLATALALTIAERRKHERVVLLDLDLTGTSLADVLLLCAPKWSDDPDVSPGTLLRVPDGFHSRGQTRSRLRDREEALHARDARVLPFLNDFLLFATPAWDGREVHPEALLWRLNGGPENLRVIPSSALPLDLERVLPVIFDEQHSAFLEARLEVLLDALVPGDGETVHVVVDVPPTIPGLSRSVLSLCIRLGQTPKWRLSEDGGMPARLDAAHVRWRANLVVTSDLQDVRAATRWLHKLQPDEERFFRVVINRHEEPDRDAALSRIRGVLHPSLRTVSELGAPPDATTEDASDWHPILDRAVTITNHKGYRFFHEERLPGGSFDDLLDEGDS